MRKVIPGVMFILIVASAITVASAQCDCMGAAKDIRGSRYSSAYEELKHSDVVFYGQVVEIRMVDKKPVRNGSKDYEVEIKFRVEKAWRKDVKEYITISDAWDTCIIGFDITEHWLVYAHFDDRNILRTGYCSRTRVVYRNIENDFKEFAKHGEPQTKIIKQ